MRTGIVLSKKLKRERKGKKNEGRKNIRKESLNSTFSPPSIPIKRKCRNQEFVLMGAGSGGGVTEKTLKP